MNFVLGVPPNIIKSYTVDNIPAGTDSQILNYTSNKFSIVLVSDYAYGRTALYLVPRWFAVAAIKIAGDDNLVYIHRDSQGGSPYFRNMTGQMNGFYILEILGY